MISLADLARLLQPHWRSVPEDPSSEPVSQIVIDSREAAAGAVFVALPGENVDGHRFTADAVRRGASAVLISDPNAAVEGATNLLVDDTLAALQDAGRRWRREQRAQVVGITGSVGKTTVREAVAQLLSQHLPTHQSPRNYNGDIGLPIALLGIRPEHEWAVIEIGPYSQQEMEFLVSAAAADVGIVTNVGPTHLERFGTIADTERIKGLLPESLRSGGLAILNADDPATLRMASRTAADVVTIGLSEHADLQATGIVAHGFEGIRFSLQDKRTSELVDVSTPLIGAHQARTALAAAAVGLRAGLALEQIADSLAHLRPGSRLRRAQAQSGATVIDDAYNAAPLSMRAALDLLESEPPGRIAVLGDMLELGTEERTAHREVGVYAAPRCDRLIAVGERSRDLAEAARDAGLALVDWYPTPESASVQLEAILGPDDTVLVKASHAIQLEAVVAYITGYSADGGGDPA